ncbi:MAG TPA: 3-phosphoglycerate dehydrogenase family protein [Thermoanaerobaculia bacterium]|nr:3-phosphoglycerate dehydrogenase family protein [Thermoanaerobaculia bacterium]
MKVLIADNFEKSGVEGLEAAGCEVIHRPELKDEALTQAIAETQADVLVVRSTKVTEAMLNAGRLSLVVRAGAGYNTIDVAAASRRGIYVSNCPGKNSIAVAELTLALILALDRRVPDNVAELRAGRWNKKEYSKARGLHGQTLGLLGAGNIAVEVIRRAAAFGLGVVLWSRRFDGQDRPLSEEEAQELGLAGSSAQVVLAPSPAEVAARCDILSVHLALKPETRGLVDAALLARLKPGAMVINTSRGELVDSEALAAAVREKGLRVGLDVFGAEPATATGEMNDPIAGLPGVYGTHHIGASTAQAQEAIAAETVRIVRTYMETGKVPNVVNLARKTPASHMLVVRHRDRPGVLAHVFEHLRAGSLNVQETENIVFEGAEAAVARINLDHEPAPALLDEIRGGNADVLDLQLIAL